MKWITVVFVIGLLNVGHSFDYDATPMEDPLQPIWDRLAALSQDILDGFKGQMGKFVQSTQAHIESRLDEFKKEMNNSGTASQPRDDRALVNEVKEEVSAWIEIFYASTIRKENDAAITKAEGNINVKIDAFENKLIEHINIKFAALSYGGGDVATNSTAVVPAGTQLVEMESKITSHITTKLIDIENSVSEQLQQLASSMTTSSRTLSTISTHVTKIVEEIADVNFMGSGGGGTSPSSGETSVSCTTLVDQVSTLLNGSQLSTDYLNKQELRWKEMQTVIAKVRDTPSYLPRDCSDIHWHHPEAQSGVYQIYPTLDRKDTVSVWCNMAEDGDKADGGWTVILRRRESDFRHLDFNRTWKEYADGFGDPSEGEWWFSLSSLHALTYRMPYAVRILMTDIEDGPIYADYSVFRVEDEARDFRLVVDGFSGNVSLDAFKSKHHGSPFSTSDRDNDKLADDSCAAYNAGGWWFNACHYTTLTAPFPTTEDREARTIRWRTADKWLVLNDVTVEIRPGGYAARFDTHREEEE